MGSLFSIWFFVLFQWNSNPVTIPAIEVNAQSLVLHPIEGKWYYDEKPFSGYSISTFANGKVFEKISCYQGKKEGLSQKWDTEGNLRYQANFTANKRHGKVKVWSEKGVLMAESNFKYGVVDGVQRKWYPSGKLFKKTHIKNGKEEGIQQTWWGNGKLYVNYEAKNGRIFGMKRSTLCYELANEEVKK